MPQGCNRKGCETDFLPSNVIELKARVSGKFRATHDRPFALVLGLVRNTAQLNQTHTKIKIIWSSQKRACDSEKESRGPHSVSDRQVMKTAETRLCVRSWRKLWGWAAFIGRQADLAEGGQSGRGHARKTVWPRQSGDPAVAVAATLAARSQGHR